MFARVLAAMCMLIALDSQAANAPEASAAESPVAPAGSAPSCPLYQQELLRAQAFLDEMIKQGVRVPAPIDPGGGASHEQHKRNYQAIYQGGQLFAATRERRHFEFVRDLLLAYAAMYPQLGPHPAHGRQEPGRLFWQNLNDSVWLVHTIQGYGLLRESFSDEERQRIESRLLRPAAEFLALGSPRSFGRIHNHATWATAAVGMTGYVLGDDTLVKLALLGPKQDGKAGFLRQIDLLFSPDGYYSEGPYYQRYALLPFLVFADAIERNQPELRVFERRDGLLAKALNTTIELSYGGYFLPINDALKDKSLRTAELYEAIALVYAQTGDARLLDIASMQNRTVLSERGRALACAIAAGKAQPFPMPSRLIRDGAEGGRGALALLRSGAEAGHQLVVAKNTSQGMGHGHFDKLNWLFYDNGAEIIRDYGAVRFLNIEAKQGGVYLPENESWAKQTVAHNTLVRDQQSHFAADLNVAERRAPQQLHYSDDPQLQISVARIDGAYPDTRIQRSLALLPVPGFELPVVLDLVHVQAAGEHQFDLPLHYSGQIMRSGAPLRSHAQSRPVLGAANGYQHLWLDAEATPSTEQAYLTWLLADRFYTWRWLPQPDSRLLLAESGANDPAFNLRREPVLIQRVKASGGTTFVGVLEPHGRYDGAAEQTLRSDSQIRSLEHLRGGAIDLVVLTTRQGARVLVALSNDEDPAASHQLTYRGQTLDWQGFAARFDLPPHVEDDHAH